jgi:6-phospho-beta-glucosidase
VASADGTDLLGDQLRDRAFVNSTMQRFFEPALRARTAMWLNEYLFYWYYAEQAVASVASETRTRGEEVEALNEQLMSELEAALRTDPPAALERYTSYHGKRFENYMHYADPDSGGRPLGDNGEGYAGVALDVIEALQTGTALYTALNVRNQQAIDGFAPDDVVEVSCVVDGDGIRPVEIGSIPEHPAALMSTVKHYERLATRAIRERSRELAIDALMANPLVLSFPRARGLVDAYLEAHRPWAG